MSIMLDFFGTHCKIIIASIAIVEVEHSTSKFGWCKKVKRKHKTTVGTDEGEEEKKRIGEHLTGTLMKRRQIKNLKYHFKIEIFKYEKPLEVEFHFKINRPINK